MTQNRVLLLWCKHQVCVLASLPKRWTSPGVFKASDRKLPEGPAKGWETAVS